MDQKRNHPTRNSRPAPAERGDRLGLVVQTAALLFLCAAAAGYLLLNHRDFPQFRDIAMLLGPPASASLLFVAAALGFPNLLAPGKIAFPHNLTLPVVFSLLIRVSVIVWASPSSAVFRANDPLMPALLWTNSGPLVIAALIQCVVFSIIVLFGSR